MKKKLLTTLAVGIWVVSASHPVCAEQIAPNPNYGTITTTNSSWNIDYLDNYGTLDNNFDGTLTNFNTLNNYANLYNSGGHSHNGGILINYGTLNNYANLSNDIGYYYKDYNYLTNYGTLNNYESGTLSNAGALTNSGTLSNAGALTNYGALTNFGALTNSGTLSNDGALTNYGKLINHATLNNSVAGVITGTGTYTQLTGNTINNGAMVQQAIQILGGQLSGTGAITGNVTIGSGATVKPGDPIGALIINGDYTSSGKLLFEIFGQGNGEYNQLIINSGDVLFTGGGMEFNFMNDYHAVAGDRWDLMFASSIVGLDTLTYTLNGLDSGLGWKFEYTNGLGSLEITPVPIPGAVWLLGSGLIGLAGLRRKNLFIS